MNATNLKKVISLSVLLLGLGLPSSSSASAVNLRETARHVTSHNHGFQPPVGELNVINYFNPAPSSGSDDYYAAGHHRGIDIALAPGSEIMAPADGVVKFSGTLGRPFISIAHADGLVSVFEPVVSEFRAGDAVSAGQVIGVLSAWPNEVGTNATHCPGMSCFHWGVHRDDQGRDDAYVDPLWLLGLAGPIVLLPTN